MFLYHLNYNGVDSLIWGPYFWFFLHTISIKYPLNPNSNIKKKYYNLIIISLLIPNEKWENFSKLLDEYPSYTLSRFRESFINGLILFIIKVNIYLKKPMLTYEESMLNYYNYYKPKKSVKKNEFKSREKIVFFSILCMLLIIIVILSIRE